MGTTATMADNRGRNHGGKIIEALRAKTSPRMVQVAVGVWVPMMEPAPEYCLAKWVRDKTGKYTLVPDEISMVRLNSKVARLLGFDGQWHTLYRLAAMGCIEIIKIAPHVNMLNLDSYFNHLRRCAEDPFLWDEGSDYCREYRKNYHQMEDGKGGNGWRND